MSEVAAIVFGMGGLLGLIALLPPLADRLRVPYTVLLAVLGVILGIFVSLAARYDDAVEDRPQFAVVEVLSRFEVTPEVFLWAFLPLLLFQTALELDTRALIEELGPVLLMAIVAVVATTMLVGTTLWWASPYALPACLLVGAIIATTDPIAVVAIFQDVGAPRRLVNLVEGESLLNDAAAIALSASFIGIVVSETAPSTVLLTIDFLWQFAGGVVLGMAIGRVGALAIARLDEGGPAEITMSVAVAYLAYAISEIVFSISGVVAAVSAGLVFGAYCRAHLARSDWDSVTRIWRQLSFWASSLVFVLASMLVPRTLGEAEPRHVFFLIVLIVSALIARALVLYGCLPILRWLRLSSRVQNNYKAVMLWGGLRGAVTLALALSVTENTAVPSEVRDLVGVLATGFVLFTLIVQATTLRPLIHLLRLDELSATERFLRNRALALTRDEVTDRLEEAAREHGLKLDDLGDVKQLYRRYRRPLQQPTDAGEEMLRTQLISALITLSRQEIELYLEERARRMVSRTSGAYLARQAGGLIDALRGDGLDGYRSLVRHQIQPDPLTRSAAWLHRRLGYTGFLARRLTIVVERDLVRRYVLYRLLGFNEARIRALFGDRTADSSRKFLNTRLEHIERSLDAMRLQYPAYWRAFTERYLVLVGVRLEYGVYEQMGDERLLSPQVVQTLLAELRGQRRELERPPQLDLGLDVQTLLQEQPLFKEISAKNRRKLAQILSTQLALPGETIVRHGERGDAMYFIASGAVEVRLDPEPIRLGTGDFFGEMALLYGEPRNADVVALGYCRLLVLPRSSFDRVLNDDQRMDQIVRTTAETRLES